MNSVSVSNSGRSGKAICSIHSGMLQHPELATLPWLGANRMVQVIGVDRRDPDTVRVIVNDTCSDDGAGAAYPFENFDRAWEIGGQYLLCAYRPAVTEGKA